MEALHYLCARLGPKYAEMLTTEKGQVLVAAGKDRKALCEYIHTQKKSLVAHAWGFLAHKEWDGKSKGFWYTLAEFNEDPACAAKPIVIDGVTHDCVFNVSADVLK